MEFTFCSRRPPPPLERFVESVWYARGQIDYPRERIAPTGSTVAVIVLGSPIRLVPDNGAGPPLVATTGFLLGPHVRPVINEPLAETDCAGVVTTPIGCQALFGVAPASLRGRAVDLLGAWPPADELRRALLDLATAEQKFDRIERTLLTNLGTGGAMVDRCEAAVRALAADPTRSISEVARALGVSHGYLDRAFVAVVGLSPVALARILRLRALLAGLDVYRPVHWSGLAAEFGWFDQSHFIRDFKRHTGVTPSEYVAAQRATYTPAEAGPGFVPQR